VGVVDTQVSVSAASTVSFHAGMKKAAPPANAARVVRREISSELRLFLFMQTPTIFPLEILPGVAEPAAATCRLPSIPESLPAA
jgi:hypothetical protein